MYTHCQSSFGSDPEHLRCVCALVRNKTFQLHSLDRSIPIHIPATIIDIVFLIHIVVVCILYCSKYCRTHIDLFRSAAKFVRMGKTCPYVWAYICMAIRTHADTLLQVIYVHVLMAYSVFFIASKSLYAIYSLKPYRCPQHQNETSKMVRIVMIS